MFNDDTPAHDEDDTFEVMPDFLFENALAFHQAYSEDDRTRIENHLVLFSGEDSGEDGTSFPFWWRQNIRTLEFLEVSKCFPVWFLLRKISEPAQSALNTETITSGMLEGIWEDLHLKFGGS